MPFTGKFRVLNDIRIYQMGCQGILCVNTFAEYHLKPNSSYLWAFDLVFLNKVLYTFFPTQKLFMLLKPRIGFFTHKKDLCVRTGIRGNVGEHISTE